MKWFNHLLPRRLDVQMALVCVLVIISTMPWFIVHEASEDLEYFLDSMQKQTKVLADNIAVNSVEHVITNDYTSLEQLLMRSVLFPGVVDIQITNKTGQILSDVFLNSDSQPDARYSGKPFMDIPESASPQSLMKENVLVVWAPIESGENLGWVKLNYSLESANRHKVERIKDYLKDVSVITLIMIILLILAMRRPLRMISAASSFANRLADKTGEQIPMQRQSRELDNLYTALNWASSNLSEQDSTINKIVKDLETQKLALDEHSIVSITDVDGVITYANDKLLSSTGYETHELLGKTHRIIGSQVHKKEFFMDMWATITKGKVWHGDIVNLNKEGDKIWMQTTIVPFLGEDGKPYEYVAIQTDITTQKNIEALLAEKNKSLEELADQLENKVKSRTAELQVANEELMQLNTVKSDFVSIVSHELRTPLTSIKSFAEILEDDFDELDAEERKHYLSIINEESVRLGNLINDVLDLQKIDSGKMTWNEEKTDLKKLAVSTIELFSKSYADKGLELSIELIDDDAIANVDSNKIKQVLTNLLSNAYKFTDNGSVTLEFIKVIQKPTAVVVDDDESCRLHLELRLREKGVEVVACENAQQALDVLQDKSKTIDLLITDIYMPGMNGVELIKSVRRFNDKLPVMAISSEVDKDILKSLFDYNVKSYFEKSQEPDKFDRSIEKVFGQIRTPDITNEMIEISVVDTGSGIPEDELDKVFDHFHQVDNSETREKGGSGLGLCICQEIIEHHGGKLWVTSKLGEGSRFTFNLPLLQNNKKRIGEILVEAGVVTQESLDKALANQG